MVTHQLQFLRDVKHIVVMESGGIKIQKTIQEEKEDLISQKIEEAVKQIEIDVRIGNFSFFLIYQINFISSPSSSQIQQRKSSINLESSDETDDDQKVSKESQKAGNVSSEVYSEYLKAVKSSLMVVLVAFLFIVAQTFSSGVNYFVSIW